MVPDASRWITGMLLTHRTEPSLRLMRCSMGVIFTPVVTWLKWARTASRSSSSTMLYQRK